LGDIFGLNQRAGAQPLFQRDENGDVLGKGDNGGGQYQPVVVAQGVIFDEEARNQSRKAVQQTEDGCHPNDSSSVCAGDLREDVVIGHCACVRARTVVSVQGKRETIGQGSSRGTRDVQKIATRFVTAPTRATAALILLGLGRRRYGASNLDTPCRRSCNSLSGFPALLG